MTPTYTPDDIELWRELRVAFDQDTRYKHLCFLSTSFERLWYDEESRPRLQALAGKFLKATQLDSEIQVGSCYMFLRTGVSNISPDTVRSLFIDWNIERLSTPKHFQLSSSTRAKSD